MSSMPTTAPVGPPVRHLQSPHCARGSVQHLIKSILMKMSLYKLLQHEALGNLIFSDIIDMGKEYEEVQNTQVRVFKPGL